MKVELNGKEFKELVSKVTGILNGKIVKPSSGWVMLETDGEGLKAHAANEVLGVQTAADSTVFEYGSCIVDGGTLSKVSANITSQNVSLESNDKVLKVKAGTNKSSIALVGTYEEMTAMNGAGNNSAISVPAIAFCSAMNDVKYAVSTDMTRMILTGICVKTKDNGEMEVAGLDGYRVAVSSLNYDGEKIPPFVIPARGANELVKLFGKYEGYLEMHVADGRLFVESCVTKFETVLLMGEYIDYNRIFPKEFKTKVTVKTNDFKAAIARAATLADERNKLVKMEIKDGLIRLSGASVTGTSEDEIEAKIEGEDISISFNSRYLSDVSKAVYGEYTLFSLTTAVSPVLFADGANRHLALPVRTVG